jgi:hypothetical protein
VRAFFRAEPPALPPPPPPPPAKAGNYAGTYTDGTFFKVFVDSPGHTRWTSTSTSTANARTAARRGTRASS